jgi:bifunctional polynucleotide phosphatase/kinase
LRALHDEGYHLLIVSNQGGSTGSEDTKALQLQDKIIKMGVALGLPLSAMLALDKASAMRKPSSAMWRLWASVLHHERVAASTPAGAALPPASEVSLSGLISVTESFYVGDAAGRLPTPAGTMAGRKKDFSCGDRKFAYNCGLKFYTPEEFYLGHRPTDFTWDGFGPAELLAVKRAVIPAGNFGLPAKGPEMILMVGFPGSGKSTFYRNFLASRHYQSVNRDTLKSTDKCLAAAEAALAAGKCVCVDNTNAGPADRAPFIALAKKYRVPVRAFVMTAGEGLAQRMNRLRAALGISPAVPAVAYRMMQGKLKDRPDAIVEGLAEVVDVPVVPNFAGLPPLAQRLFFEL